MQKGLDHFYAMRFHLKLPPLHALAIHSVCCDHKRNSPDPCRQTLSEEARSALSPISPGSTLTSWFKHFSEYPRGASTGSDTDHFCWDKSNIQLVINFEGAMLSFLNLINSDKQLSQLGSRPPLRTTSNSASSSGYLHQFSSIICLNLHFPACYIMIFLGRILMCSCKK